MWGVFRRFTFQTSETNLFLLKVFAERRAADTFCESRDEVWRAAFGLAVLANEGEESFTVGRMLNELGISAVGHAVLPVSSEESSIIRPIGVVGH